MSDRDHAAGALEERRAIASFEGGESVADQHRAEAIEHVEALIVELEQSEDAELPADSVEKPDDWDDEETWEDEIETAREKAGLSGSKGTLTTKTINGREYYYLQWREGEKVKSQYVAPVDPA